MAIEQLIKGVMDATPSVRRKVEEVLKGIDTTKQQNGKRETRLITISGAAKMLSLGRNTVYKLIQQKRLDVVMLTGVPRVTYQSIVEFLDGQRPENAATAEMIGQSKARYQAAKAKEVK